MNARPEAAYRHDPKIDALRVPPQSVPAEQSVLGGLMLAPESFDRIADVLVEGDFYRRDHRLIFRAIAELQGKRKPFDAVTLGEWFESNKLAEQIGGTGYLIELASTTPSAANITAYAEIVREKAICRQLITAGTEIVNDGFAPAGQSALQLLGAAQERLGRVLMTQPAELEPAAVIVERVHERSAARHARGGQIEGLTTGFDELDALLGGLRDGCLYVVAGRPKTGKTTLAMNIAEHVALTRCKRVPVHSLEMTPEELVERSASSLSGVPHNRARLDDMDPDERSRYYGAIGRISRSGLLFSRPRSVRSTHLCAQTRRVHAEDEVGLVVVDYLQLMDLSNAERRDIAVGDTTRELKMLAQVIEKPVILLSQLNRGLESRPDKRPIPADLRDGGAIEQDADAVIFVYRDELYHKDSREAGTAELIVALNRHGPTGMVRVGVEFDCNRFVPLPIGWEPAPAPVSEDGAPRRRGFRKLGGRDRAAGGDE